MKLDTLTPATVQLVAMSDIEDTYSPGIGRHWFDRGARRFFRTRLPAYGIQGPGGTFFTSSEQPPHGRRWHSVRQLVGPGDINTRGEFCTLTPGRAKAVAARLAKGETVEGF